MSEETATLILIGIFGLTMLLWGAALENRYRIDDTARKFYGKIWSILSKKPKHKYLSEKLK